MQEENKYDRLVLECNMRTKLTQLELENEGDILLNGWQQSK